MEGRGERAVSKGERDSCILRFGHRSQRRKRNLGYRETGERMRGKFSLLFFLSISFHDIPSLTYDFILALFLGIFYVLLIFY